MARCSWIEADNLCTYISQVVQSLASSSKEVRTAATVAVGHWLSDVACAAEFAANPERVAGAGKWAELVGDALLDSSNMASAAAFDAVRYPAWHVSEALHLAFLCCDDQGGF